MQANSKCTREIIKHPKLFQLSLKLMQASKDCDHAEKLQIIIHFEYPKKN